LKFTGGDTLQVLNLRASNDASTAGTLIVGQTSMPLNNGIARFSGTIIDPTLAFNISIYGAIYHQATVSNEPNPIYGAKFDCLVNSVNTKDWTGGAYGISSEIDLSDYSGGAAGAYTVAHATLYSGTIRPATNVTVTTAIGYLATNPNTIGGFGSIGTNYGMRIDAQTAGTTDYGLWIDGADTYALYVNAGASYFGGAVTLNSTLSLPNNTYLKFKNSTGTDQSVLAMSAGNTLSFDNPVGNLSIQPTSAYDVTFFNSIGTGRSLTIGGTTATGGDTIKDSAQIYLRGRHWTGAASAALDTGVFTDVITAGATPVHSMKFYLDTAATLIPLEMRNDNGTMKIAFFGATANAQHVNIADAAGGTEIVTINAILDVLDEYGLTQ
jgi:hypothetical protein